MENLYTTNKIRTFTGKYIDVFDPNSEDICIEDIAHALSCVPRFGGHLPRFYSVCEHSILTFQLMEALNPSDKKAQLLALMHDASEAYLLDMPTPIKSRMPEYKMVENSLMQCIARKFGFEYPMDEFMKAIDKMALETEWDILMLNKKVDGIVLRSMTLPFAERKFISIFNTIIS